MRSIVVAAAAVCVLSVSACSESARNDIGASASSAFTTREPSATSTADFDSWLAEMAEDNESVAENAGSGMTDVNDPRSICEGWSAATGPGENVRLAEGLVALAAKDGVTGTQEEATAWLNANCA